ncbi:MAG: alanine racemase [Methylococcales bacterium]|nr:alanine racemase [Methylococcales bacterium]
MINSAYALINLSAIEHNIAKVKEYAPQAKIMAVIKANAYGHGLLTVVKALAEVDAVAVARISEGIRLRNAGFKDRVLILEGFVSVQELEDLIIYDLEAVIHSWEQIEVLKAYQAKQKLSVWLKLDSGMNRLGLKVKEFSAAYQQLQSCHSVNQPISLMTHLSSADDVNSDVTVQQISRFNDVVNEYPDDKSIANSAGLLAWPDSITDWVRPGIMLYGVSPFQDKNGKEFGLKPVMSFFSRLLAVKDIAIGDSVGYAGTWVCQKPTKLGVIAIGYGDGYPRYAKPGTPVLVNGQRVSLVGRVSMDMITVDLTSESKAKAGDPVTLWGEGLAVEEIAHYSDTIPYTLLCGVTQRVEMRTK